MAVKLRAISRVWIAIALALAATAFSAHLPERAEAACEADVCMEMESVTGAAGIYVLVIAKPSVELLFPNALWDCVWRVEARYSDGSPSEEYEFDAGEVLAGKTFSAFHQFPEPGVYSVLVLARDGVHAGSEEPCPSIQIDATVVYPEPPPPPPPPPPPGEPPPDPEGPVTPASPSSPVIALAPLPQPQATPERRSYWRRCGSVLVHAVGCRRAALVVRRARSLLARARTGRFAGPPAFEVLGFDCRVRHRARLPLACRRGAQRLRAPLGGSA